MISSDVFQYVRAQQAAGFSRHDIEAALAASGWSVPDIAQIFSVLEAGAQHPDAHAQSVSHPVPATASHEPSHLTATPTLRALTAIDSQLRAGVGKDTVRALLLGVGWDAHAIDEAFTAVEWGESLGKPEAARAFGDRPAPDLDAIDSTLKNGTPGPSRESLSAIDKLFRDKVSKESVRTLLAGVGWNQHEIDEAFLAVEWRADQPTAAIGKPSLPDPLRSAVHVPPEPSRPRQFASMPPRPVGPPEPVNPSRMPEPVRLKPFIDPLPQPQPPVQKSPPIRPITTSMPAHTRSRRGFLFGAIGVLVVLAAAFAVYWFALRAPSSSQLLRSALINTMEAQSFAYAATTTASLGAMQKSPPDMTATAQGVVNFASTPLVSAEVNALAHLSDASGTTDLSAHAQTAWQGAQAYFNIDDFSLAYSPNEKSGSPDSRALFVVLADQLARSLENQWVTTDAGALFAATNTAAIDLPASQSALRNYMTGLSYVQHVDDIGGESLQGAPVEHLRISIQHTPALIAALHDAYPQNALFQSDPSDIRAQDVQHFLLEPMQVDAWVDTSDRRIERLSLAPLPAVDRESGFNGTIGFEIAFSNFNQAALVTIPPHSTPLSQFWQTTD